MIIIIQSVQLLHEAHFPKAHAAQGTELPFDAARLQQTMACQVEGIQPTPHTYETIKMNSKQDAYKAPPPFLSALTAI